MLPLDGYGVYMIDTNLADNVFQRDYPLYAQNPSGCACRTAGGLPGPTPAVPTAAALLLALALLSRPLRRRR